MWLLIVLNEMDLRKDLLVAYVFPVNATATNI